MSVAAVLRPADYESRLQRYLFERAEEGRAVRVGEKEISERAEIVARYAELFTREQLEALACRAEIDLGEAAGDPVAFALTALELTSSEIDVLTPAPRSGPGGASRRIGRPGG